MIWNWLKKRWPESIMSNQDAHLVKMILAKGGATLQYRGCWHSLRNGYAVTIADRPKLEVERFTWRQFVIYTNSNSKKIVGVWFDFERGLWLLCETAVFENLSTAMQYAKSTEQRYIFCLRMESLLPVN